jgi:sarcosine oxidase
VEIAVVGAGVAGLAAARALRRAGRAPVVYEQFDAVHDRGSSHGASRIFRLSYPDSEWVALARESLAGWHELEAELGLELVRTTGSLDAGAHVETHAAALREAGEAAELLEGAGCERRFGVRTPAGEPVLHQPEGGIVRADRALAALRSGATMRERTRVEALEPDGDGVVLDTSSGRLRARVAVVAAGAWAPRLLATAGIALDALPTRETVAFFAHPAPDRLPPLIEAVRPPWAPPGRISYALPDPGRGIKAGVHHAGPRTEPDTAGAADARVAEWASAWVAERFPGAEAEQYAVQTCLYTTTPDERFVLDRRGPIVVGSACSGHGFKFGPAVGARLAALALEAL